MAAARERLTDTSEKLRVAFASLHAVDEEVVARTTGVGVLPLSQATTRVSQAAGTAKTVALTVLKAAEAAEEAATTAAAAAVSAAQTVKAIAAAKSEAAKAAGETAEAAKAAAESTKAAATVALKSEIDPPILRDRPSGDNSGSNGACSMSAAGMKFETGDISVAIKHGESDMPESEEQRCVSPHDAEDGEEEHESLYDGDVASEVGNADFGSADQERQEEAEGALGIDGGKEMEVEEENGEREEQPEEEEEEEEEEGDDEEHGQNARRGKRKLGGTAKAPRRYSLRTAGSRRPNYAESGREHEDAMLSSTSDVEHGDVPVAVEPIRERDDAEVGGGRRMRRARSLTQEEPSNRQRTASEPGRREQSGGSEATAAPQTSTPMIARRHGQQWRPCCKEHGCTKWPSYGGAGSKKVEFCAQHAKKGMVNLRSRRCDHPGCMKQPSYGRTGSNKVEFFSQHAKKGMVDLRSRRCDHPGCMKQPSYGRAGGKKREFCSLHAEEGMVRPDRKCGHPGCIKQPSYGKVGSILREFFSPHAKKGMVSLRNGRCGHPG